MQAGKILQASQDGVYVLKLLGDVRLTLCKTFDDFIEDMFSADNFASVAIDLSDVDGLDSTTLGLLAKIAIRAEQRFNFKPIIVSTDASITRLLTSMCFERIFDIREQSIETLADYGELPIAVSSEQEVKARVLDAHRTLMGLSEENETCFKDLVNALEQDSSSGAAHRPSN
ncbi:MAG: STAS domain-containing protein [Pseudomonadales bacterium]